jgi:hypothetical protein
MDNQIFILLSGLVIAALGFGYIVSKKFALAYFYKLNAFGRKRDLFMKLIPENIGVFVIRFVLGPILLIVGSTLVFTAW